MRERERERERERGLSLCYSTSFPLPTNTLPPQNAIKKRETVKERGKENSETETESREAPFP
jgi:hypothetical protein